MRMHMSICAYVIYIAKAIAGRQVDLAYSPDFFHLFQHTLQTFLTYNVEKAGDETNVQFYMLLDFLSAKNPKLHIIYIYTELVHSLEREEGVYMYTYIQYEDMLQLQNYFFTLFSYIQS